METKSSRNIPKVERDPRFFLWFMTLVIAVIYGITLANVPSLRQTGRLVPFTALLVIHIALHWLLEAITSRPGRAVWYIIVQGILALTISSMSGSTAVTFVLFMALIGEAVGLLSLTRQGLLAVVYYLVLLSVNVIQISGMGSSGTLLLGTVPMVIFVVIYVSLYMRQMDAREKAQSLAAELEAANRQLAEYAAQVEDLTITNERQRMARELHDTLSQGLAGLILQLEAADAHLSNNRNEKAHIIVSDAMVQARSTLANARHAIDDLRQPFMDDLDSAIRLEMHRFTDASGIPVHFHPAKTPPLADSIKEVLIRAVAEALTNIAHHAQAKAVEINVEAQDKSLMVTVKDDGQGFDAFSIPAGHYGILGIKERVRSVNGSLEIQSGNGDGTVLKIQVPI